jgi:hypothetical protein
MPDSATAPYVPEPMLSTSGTSRCLNYQLPTPHISDGGQSTLSSPLSHVGFSQSGIVIRVGQVQISDIFLTVQGELEPHRLELISGPVTRADRAMAAWATGTGIHGKELRVEFEDGD